MTYDASNRKDIRRAQKAAAIAERDRIQFLATIMSTTPGRAWMYDLLTQCQIFSTVPTFNPHQDYFALGQRNVGSRLFSEIMTHCPDQYTQMTKEENVRLHADANAQQPRSPNGNWGVDRSGGADDDPDGYGTYPGDADDDFPHDPYLGGRDP